MSIIKHHSDTCVKINNMEIWMPLFFRTAHPHVKQQLTPLGNGNVHHIRRADQIKKDSHMYRKRNVISYELFLLGLLDKTGKLDLEEFMSKLHIFHIRPGFFGAVCFDLIGIPQKLVKFELLHINGQQLL